MEIFKLFGSIFVDNDKANQAIDETDGKAEGLAGKFGKLGVAAGALGGAIVAGIGSAVTAITGLVLAGDDLQKSLNSLQMQTGATEQEMEGMEESLLSIYKAGYGESFDDIASAMANVKQTTGATGEELESMTQEALKMRDVFGFEVNESMRTVSVMMKNFGITSDEAFTLLAQGQQMGVNASDDMLDTFLEYSPIFEQLGFDAEGMLDILNTGMQNGVRNSDVLADAIKEFGIRVKDESKLTAESFAGLGLDASKMSQEFAKGGESAQTAFEKTMAALAKIEDPVERNTIGVGLFGTKFEDLEYQAVLSLGNVQEVADKSADTLKKIDEIRFNSVGEAISGIWRIFNAEVLIPLEQKMMPSINNAFNTIKNIVPGIIDLFKGDSLPLIEAITESFSEEKQIPVINFFLSVRDGVEKVKAAFISVKDAAIAGWGFLQPYIIPMVTAIVTFVGEKVTMLKQFWEQNGAQIVLAAQNAFQFIWNIVQFFMPAVLLLIQSVWGNIQGVFDGALKIIMGLLKVFAGIFTGDWKKMWEGVKQLISGALEFLWNLFNLMMIGKLLGGIKSFISSGINFFKSFGTSVVATFKQFIDDAISWFNYFRQTGSSIWQATFDTVKNTVKIFKNAAKTSFDEVFSTAKSIFGKVKDAIMNPIRTAKDQVKGFIEEIKSFFRNLSLKLPDIKTPRFKLKNWSKNPVDWLKAMPSIDIDWYAKGTNYAPGGLSVIGEHGAELVELPKGSKVHTASQTRSKLGGGDTNVNFYNTFTSKPMTPSEINRKEKQMMRNWALEYGGI
ncbi:phage tail tape measure protein [Cytobacillus sp. FSL H8-0458]|uniref:phage tail tape measure protein n=1 Tax=Cytobacillus sp. FSL H8-0458 TaxID=2975346 RepID=UPI0030FB340E